MCTWTERLDIVKISILPRLSYTFHTITIKIPAGYFFPPEEDKLIVKCIRKCKGIRISRRILENNKFGGLIPPCPRFSIKL